MPTVLDYATGPPSAASIRAAGHDGAIRYISPAREPWMSGKPAHRSEVDDFDTHGLKMATVWQHRKGGSITSGDAGRGFAGGVADATAAQEHLNRIHCSGHPVFFAIDWNITIDEWNNVVADYIRGAASVLGKQRVGIYGHAHLIHWAGPEDDLIAQVAPGRWLGWQTSSWVGGGPRDYAVLYQRLHNVSGPDGVQVDVNDVLHPEWGWRALDAYQQPPSAPVPVVQHPTLRPNPAHRGDPHFLPDVLRAFGVPVEVLGGWDSWGMGDFDRIWGVCVHHTGSNSTSAAYIARNTGLRGALSSQLHQSRTPPYSMTLCGVGPAWHMGRGSYPGLPTDNANPLLIGIEPQSNGVDPWPPGMLDIYYRAVAAILWYLGHSSSRCISHWEYSLVAQGKWDPGAGDGVSGHVMDMEIFRARVQHYIDNPPFMEGISLMALDLSKRYASRVPGSTWDGSLEDVWLNTDAHAFVARSNTEAILMRLDRMEKQRSEDRELNLALIDTLSGLAAYLKNGKQ